MRVRIVDPATAPGLIDPDTKRRPFIDPETGRVLTEAIVPDTQYWHRRVRDREIELVIDGPTGREPIVPLTTR